MEQLPNWAHAQDMRALLENVENQEFKALSVGLGLGSVRRSGRQSKAAQIRTDTLTTAPATLSVAPRRAVHRSGAHRAALGAAKKVSKDSAHLRRRLLAWVVDFLLVVATLTFAVATMIAFSVSRGPVAPWVEQRPVQWLVQTSPLITLSLVYGVFLVYGLLFKLLVGRTCGETLLGVSPNRIKSASGT